MKIFSCSTCGQLLFFENTSCTKCQSVLAYLPDHAVLSVLRPLEIEEQVAGSPTVFEAASPKASGQKFRLCDNGATHQACNWAVPVEEDEPLCRACRLNDVIPDLSQPQRRVAWARIESAKRRLLYTLFALGLPVQSKRQQPEGGLAFCFMADGANQKVFTGHSDGTVTINVAEADDPFREKMRTQLGETYRTVLGHFRHEIGHYYWDRLIAGTPWLDRCRELFGDETADYQQSLDRHYKEGPAPDWQERFVSAYASMHPWEDWAETWAHYLHMVDTLETARSYGLVMRARPVEGAPLPSVSTSKLDVDHFEDLMSAWVPLTLALNSLNRGMGMPDLYPFVLTPSAVAKLRFVHEVIEANHTSSK